MSTLPLQGPRTIGELFSVSSREHADRPALITRAASWSYRELARRVDAAAVSIGAGLAAPRPRVGIVGANHPGYVVGFLAAQRAGASTVEIGPTVSSSVVAELAARTGVSVLLTDRTDLPASVAGNLVTLGFDDILRASEHGPARARPAIQSRPADPSDEASIVFTSGTTALPKGVVLSHANFMFVTSAVCGYLGLRPDDRYGLALPLAHTYGKSVLLTSLASGAAIVLLDTFSDLPAFLGLLTDESCTVLSIVPYHAEVLLRRGGLEARALPALRLLTISGSRLARQTAERLASVLPGTRIFSMYGLTEATTRVSYLPPELLLVKPDSCGRPLPGVEVAIRGDDGRWLPSGGDGEVMVRGPNVMAGYFDDAALTAETLTDGWLATGDVGTLDEEGYLYLHGRRKDIIKCAGERVSPAAVEAVVSSFPGVSEVAAVGRPDPLLGEAVVAYIVVTPDFAGEAPLRTFCAARLAPHEAPRRYCILDHLPRTPTGKLQKRLLPT